MKIGENRELLHTQVTPYKDRLKAWQESLDSTNTQISLAQTFQKAGERIIKKIQSMKNDETIDPEKLIKQYQQCLTCLEKGIKIEREARKELFNLQHHQPKER